MPQPSMNNITHNSNPYSSTHAQFATNRTFPTTLTQNTNSVTTNISSINSTFPRTQTIRITEQTSHQTPRTTVHHRVIPTMTNANNRAGNNGYNYIFIQGSQAALDFDRDLNDMFGPGGVFQRQLQHIHQTMNGLNRLFNNFNRPSLSNSPFQFLEALEDTSFLEREFDDNFLDIILSHSSGRNSSGQRGLQREELENLPATMYQEPESLRNKSKSNDETQESDNKKSCVICLNDFQNGEHIRTLPCVHNFHKDCIDNWLTQKGCCPICRRTLT